MGCILNLLVSLLVQAAVAMEQPSSQDAINQKHPGEDGKNTFDKNPKKIQNTAHHVEVIPQPAKAPAVSSNPNGPPNLNKQSSFPGLPGQAAKPVPIKAPSAQSASDESGTPVSLPTTPAADSSTPASGATSPATSQAGSPAGINSDNASSQSSSPEEKELEEHHKKNNIPLKYIDNDYTADRAFMPEPLRKAIDTLSISKAQMNVHNEAADEFKSHTEKECLSLKDSCEKKIKGWTSSYETKHTTRLENREAALATEEAARADAVKEQEVKQTAANQKSIDEEQARIEKLTQELEARKATLAAEVQTATIAKTEELAQ